LAAWPGFAALSQSIPRWLSEAEMTTIDTRPETGDLVIEGLTVEYSSGGYAVRPIDTLDLTMRSGELVLLLGASGCGKSTLLSVLASILTPSAGRVRLGTHTITGLRGAELTRFRRHTVGVIFQAFNLIPSLTALENVMVPMRAAGISRTTARERATTLLESVGLAERLQHKPSKMSGGQQQRVAIARALAHDPPLVLADEPTAHLDYIQVDGVLRLLRSVAQPGRIVVVATHDERMIPLADRVVELTPRSEGEALPPETLNLTSGDVVFDQGAVGDRVYIVEAGEIELVRVRIDRTEELLSVARTGDYFGELAPLFGLRRAATARARIDSIVTGLSLRDFRATLQPGSVAQLLERAADG
jgi:putative ABC transport system ATP-binding protein